MIELKNLTKSFTTKTSKGFKSEMTTVNAVNQVSLECRPGRIFSLLGPNGAGKTTTLRIIAGIINPSSGTAIVDGIDISNGNHEVKKRIGFLTGSTGLYERLNPDETIDFFGKLYRLPEHQLTEQKEYLFEKLGINEFRKKRVGQMSTGMKQKVSIARTLIHDPEVLIFDEPTSGLDVITADSIIDLIRESKENNKTVIFSSHIMSEVDLLCDDLAIISKGSIIYNDTFENFKKEMKADNLTQEFINRVKEA
ncbi:ATP-binding cassette domain-containing protein [Flavobacteriaceae bacterium TP-CH-4]|uniref:ATP-binding cassette domain-containing protein n=1 Tax=Pelagihabitans pacificus TaxID=2696054 RepID=A0A967AQ51_9FLAO|nr:ATP-binding cassette domain-containing protein [Pelagihabitans pacificus]NHF58371.1 ATP-binding cassette domain-containing protein [Pelagihabitans pacificus]